MKRAASSALALVLALVAPQCRYIGVLPDDAERRASLPPSTRTEEAGELPEDIARSVAAAYLRDQQLPFEVLSAAPARDAPGEWSVVAARRPPRFIVDELLLYVDVQQRQVVRVGGDP